MEITPEAQAVLDAAVKWFDGAGYKAGALETAVAAYKATMQTQEREAEQ